MSRAKIAIFLIVILSTGMVMGGRRRHRNRGSSPKGRRNQPQKNVPRTPEDKKAEIPATIPDSVGDLTSKPWSSNCKNCGKYFPKEIVRDIHEMCCTVSGSGPGYLLPNL